MMHFNWTSRDSRVDFLLLLKKIFSMYPLVMKYEAIQSKFNPLDLMCAIRLNKILGMLAVVIPKMLITSRYRGWKCENECWTTFSFCTSTSSYLTGKNASQIFLQWSKKVFFFSMQICDGKRKTKVKFSFKKRSIFSNNSIKNLSLVLSLQVHHEWIAPWMLEIHMGAFGLKCQHVQSPFTKSFLFSKQWNKSLDCNQAINKC